MGCLSGIIQINAMHSGTSFLKPSVGPEVAVTTVLNIVNIAYFIGSFIGPIIGGALLQYLEYGMVFAVWSPVYVLVGIVILIFFYKCNNM